MILKFINYTPKEIKFCYVINVVDIELNFGKVEFRQAHNSKWVSIPQGDLKIKVLRQLDTDETCPTVLKHASLLEMSNVLEFDEL